MTLRAKYAGTCARCGLSIPAGAWIEWERGKGATHASVADCTAAQAAQPAGDIAGPAPLSLAGIVAFLEAAKARGLQAPKLRVLAPDGKTEMRLRLTEKGKAPGSLSVTVGGEYIGAVRPTGETTGQLATAPAVQAQLIAVSEDPAAAAKAYAALMGLCSFCALPLTDAGSVEVGYGPVCADRWGLPHQPKGTPVLTTPAAEKRESAMAVLRRILPKDARVVAAGRVEPHGGDFDGTEDLNDARVSKPHLFEP